MTNQIRSDEMADVQLDSGAPNHAVQPTRDKAARG
jgi:hypothetical protein